MYKILYTKNIQTKLSFIEKFIYDNKNEIDKIVYFMPKKNDIKLKLSIQTNIFFYEDIEKTNSHYAMADERTLLIIENSARYKNILTRTFKRLSRIAEWFKYKILIDIVPFTTSIEYIYCPLAYISRDILSYQHFYAFRENNSEEDKNGNVVKSHDYRLISEKLSSVVTIDYDSFLHGNKLSYVECESTKEEKVIYQKKRDELFAEYDKYQPIITRLADLTNTFESRYLKLDSMINNMKGKTIVYTNIKCHNSALKKRFKNADIMTFYDNNENVKQYDNIILFELPIVKSYLFLDVIANSKQNVEIFVFMSDTTSDKLLHKKFTDEIYAINDFTKILSYEVKKNGKKDI